MIIIVDGIDRCGKTTLIDKICNIDKKLIRLKDYIFCSRDFTDGHFEDFLLGKLDTSVLLLKELSDQGYDIIVDRLHLTELVYGSIDRGSTLSKEIWELDTALSTMNCLLVLVEPTDIEWSNKQAEKDLTQHYMLFKELFLQSKIDKCSTDFNHLDEAIEYILNKKGGGNNASEQRN